MSKDYNMIFAGFGGQGVLFTGRVVAQAALLSGKEVSWLPSYGPEMRGGTANCSVCISDKTIGSPLVAEPNVLVVFNGPSYDKFVNAVAPGGKIIMDSSLVSAQCTRKDVECFGIPATQLSNDHDLQGIANIILLGKVLKEVPFATFEVIKQTIKEVVPARNAHLVEHNIRAIELGMSL